MGLDATARRRWLGGLTLAGALLMLALGLTIFWGRFSPRAFVVYWLACFGLTGLAMVIAVMDARALRERTLHEERALLEHTLKDIVTDAKTRNRTPGHPGTQGQQRRP